MEPIDIKDRLRELARDYTSPQPPVVPYKYQSDPLNDYDAIKTNAFVTSFICSLVLFAWFIQQKAIPLWLGIVISLGVGAVLTLLIFGVFRLLKLREKYEECYDTYEEYERSRKNSIMAFRMWTEDQVKRVRREAYNISHDPSNPFTVKVSSEGNVTILEGEHFVESFSLKLPQLYR